MTGVCRVAGCATIIDGPVTNDPTLDQADRDFVEFGAFREVYLAHVLHYHKDVLATMHAHAADYLKTILTKNVESRDGRLADARHDMSRLFYWVLMGDILLLKAQPAPPMPGSPGANLAPAG